MESDEASENLSSWIDLIFGYKQQGDEAVANYNVYYYLTYENNNSEENEFDEVHKKSCEAQIVHFGQIPPQLFDKPHPVRKRNK